MRYGRTTNIPFLIPTNTLLIPTVNLLADFDAANVTLSNGVFQSWNNSVGGNSITAGGTTPVYTATNPVFNNQPTLTTTDGSFAPLQISNSFLQAVTITVVFTRNTYTNGMLWALSDNSSTGNTYDLWNSNDQIGINNFEGNCYGPNEFTPTLLAAPTMITFRFPSGNIQNNKYYLNGVDVTASCIGSASNRSIGNYLFIGGSYQGYFWDGAIARLLVYDRVLTDEEIEQLHTALKTKYAIS